MTFRTHKGLVINERHVATLESLGIDDMESLMSFGGGTRIKEKDNRSVTMIESGGKTFFLKRHRLNWKERVLSLIPWSRGEDAANEWNNILLLTKLGFNTMTPVAFGVMRRFGVPTCSLTLTEQVYDAEKLETYAPRLLSGLRKENSRSKKADIIARLAVLARDLHANGLNHQDFYLGHILIRPPDGELFLIDLQRMHKNRTLSGHDRVKDIAQLIYSASRIMHITKTDLVRFMHGYLDTGRLDDHDKRFIRKTLGKTRKISRHDARLQARKNTAAEQDKRR